MDLGCSIFLSLVDNWKNTEAIIYLFVQFLMVFWGVLTSDSLSFLKGQYFYYMPNISLLN